MHRRTVRLFGLAVCLGVAGLPLMAPVAHAAKSVTIRGGGWGHGIGMSQYGAYGRALNGKGSAGILEHYYSGAKVGQGDIPGSLRVGLLQGRASIKLTSSAYEAGGGKVVFKVAGSPEVVAQGPVGTDWQVDAGSAGGARLYKNGDEVKKDGQTVWGDTEHPLVLQYEKYGSIIDPADKTNNYRQGRMEFVSYKTGSCGPGYCLSLVVILSMQKYLYGLGEVPSSWPQAVLEAQAIAGRTYAFDKVQRSGQHRYPCDCAVYDSTLDQAYTGDSKRTGSGQYWDDWKAAVDNTKGQVILFGGKPIQALYSSSSGGHTEDNENVWGGTPLPYLRGVSDAPDDVDANPNHNWTVSMSWSEFESKLKAAYGMGDLNKFEIVKPLGVSGRVTVVNGDKGGVRIVGENKTVRASGWSVRSALNLKDTLFKVQIDYEVGEKFVSRYRRLDRAPGKPTGEVYDVPRRAARSLGRAQDFQKGRLTWNRSTGRVLWQWGRVLQKYDDLGRERSALGMPASNTWGPGRYLGARYTHGSILWSSATGGHSVVGPFDLAYRKAGGATGQLGLPVKQRESAASLPNGGRRQRFEHGTLYLNPRLDEVFALWGAVEERFRALGEGSSDCGYPTSGVVVEDSKQRVSFQRGIITWTDADGLKVECS